MWEVDGIIKMLAFDGTVWELGGVTEATLAQGNATTTKATPRS